MSEKFQGQPKLAVGREHIECDAPGCSRSSPPKRCSRCLDAFYCNAKCQRAHWGDGHKERCRDIAEIQSQQVKAEIQALKVLNIRDDDGKEEATEREEEKEGRKVPSNTCCFICLSEPMMDPFMLPKCGHAFCFSCLKKWQDFASGSGHQQQQGPTCPACRAEAPDLYKSIYETAWLYAARVSNNDLTEEERRKFSELALAEIDKVDTGAAMDHRKRMPMLFSRAEILKQLKRPEEALKIFQEIEALHQEGEKNCQEMVRLINAFKLADIKGRPDEIDIEDRTEEMEADIEGRTDEMRATLHEIERMKKRNCSRLENDAVDLYQIMAECMEMMEDYKGAEDVYKFKVMAAMDANGDHITPIQSRKMYMGISRTSYYMGNYFMSIQLGLAAIEMNRCFPQIHKYVALSQKASGNVDAAIKTMGRAVNYETPWDEANRKIVIEMYEELLKEQSSVAASSKVER
eukprot:scaffold2253_cov286-Chaetoceros_neogracile.AAC.2